MWQWVAAFRIPVVFLAGVLSLVGFRASGHMEEAWLPTGTTIAVISATMVHNDWRDRFHDTKKGKTLALVHARSFFLLLVLLWGIATVCALAVWRGNGKMGILAWLAIFAGLVHSEIRRVPFLYTVLAAVTSAGAVMFPVFAGYGALRHWLLFFGATASIFGREIMKDIEDVAIDRGHKWTFPLALGVSRAAVVAGASVVCGAVLIAIAAPRTVFIAPLIGVSLFILLRKNDERIAKHVLDVGMGTVLLFLLVSL